jgi:urease accessory protein UreE
VKKQLKLFILTKYVKAISAAHALRKEKDYPVDEIYLPEQWKAEHIYRLHAPQADQVGFAVETED